MSPEQHPDQSRPPGNSQELEQLKEEILDRWRQLPSDEAAAVMVEQLRGVLGSELGQPLQRALAYGSEGFDLDTAQQQFDIPFERTSVSREDLALVLDVEDVALFGDADMRRLGDALAALYADSSFRRDLRLLAGLILKSKQSGD